MGCCCSEEKKAQKATGEQQPLGSSGVGYHYGAPSKAAQEEIILPQDTPLTEEAAKCPHMQKKLEAGTESKCPYMHRKEAPVKDSMGPRIESGTKPEGVTMAQTYCKGPLKAQGSGRPVTEAELAACKVELEKLVAEGHLEPVRSFMDKDGFAPHQSMGASSVLDGCPVLEDHDDAALFIIDPQVDFHEGGSLAVTGATADSERIAGLIRKNYNKIDHIVVSLDAHHLVHIAHGAWWKNPAGESPPPLTQILHEEVKAGKWAARDPELQQWALEYTASLEAGGRFTHIIWPNHCRVGTPGFAVSPALMPALDEWSVARQRAVTWVLKGQNNRTEMYSALKAEVPVSDDPATLMNHSLVQLLLSHRQVLVCGQAKSHCVNFTTRDLLSVWPKDRVADLIVLTDATSAVGGFEAAAEEFVKDMRAAGVTLQGSTEWQPL